MVGGKESFDLRKKKGSLIPLNVHDSLLHVFFSNLIYIYIFTCLSLLL